jgi:hypothetical protein
MPPGRDDRHPHRAHDLRQQREQADLAGKVVTEEHAAVATGFQALGDHRVDTSGFEPACLVDRGGRCEDARPPGAHAVQQRRFGQPEVKNSRPPGGTRRAVRRPRH